MSPKTVLLVDDDPDLIEAHSQVLESAGFEVLVAHDGPTGFALATARRPDVAVLDVIMSQPDEGFVLARQLREDPRTADVPLVLLTGLNAVNAASGRPFQLSDRDRDEHWLPVDRVVDKPLHPYRLVALVRELAYRGALA